MLHRENKIEAPSTTSAADLLKEVMDFYEITQVDFAKRIGISQKHLSEILSRKQYMSPVVAVRIEKVMGISSKLLLNLDADFKLHEAKAQLKKENVELKINNPLFLQTYSWVSNQ